jgi:flagellar motility protein MotE (MotC chaperone)
MNQMMLLKTIFMLSVLVGVFATPKTFGNAEPDSAKPKATEAVTPAAAPVKAAEHHPVQTNCLVSGELIQDLEVRELALKEREAAISEREKDIDAQKAAVKEELNKLEVARQEIQGVRGKELADREEKVNRLIETFETMSPKSAAQVIARVDEELATTALSRLSTAKAGKILSALDPNKSSRLSEMLAFGKVSNRKEAKDVDSSNQQSNRSPASK